MWNFFPSHLPVAVVAGVGSQDAADLHIGEPLLQHFHHVPNAQQSTERYLVEHLVGNKEGKIRVQKKNGRGYHVDKNAVLRRTISVFVKDGLTEIRASNAL